MSMPFDPIVGALVQRLHQLIACNSKDHRTRGAIMYFLMQAPFLNRDARDEASQHPNLAWLVTFERHNTSFSLKRNAHPEDYLDLVHPVVRVDVDDQTVVRPPSHERDPQRIKQDKLLRKRWLSSFSTPSYNNIAGPMEQNRNYKRASQLVLMDREYFVQNLHLDSVEEEASISKTIIGLPRLYMTTSFLCSVPLPKQVVSFVAFLRFQHLFIQGGHAIAMTGIVTTKCSLHGCNRPIKPEPVPYDGKCRMRSEGVDGMLLPETAKNNNYYWTTLRSREIIKMDLYAMENLRTQAANDLFLLPHEEAPLRPCASASCYSFCSHFCRKTFYERFERQLLCVPCEDLNPKVRAGRNGRAPTIAQQFQAALERNDRVRRRMRETMPAGEIKREFNVDKQKEHMATIHMLNVDTAVLYAASIVNELPARLRTYKWLPNDQDWRTVPLVAHQAAVRVHQVYHKHNVTSLLTNINSMPKWLREIHDSALKLL